MILQVPPLPSLSADLFERVVRGIIEHDQFDDWLPDPLYLQDERDYGQLSDADRLERLIGTEVDFLSPSVVPLPRRSGAPLTGAAIPIDLRALLHAMAALLGEEASRAESQRSALLRDKVFGFHYNPDRIPVFSPPGEEVDDAIDQAIKAGAGSIHLVDVNQFNHAADPARLRLVLEGAGLDPRAVELIGVVAALGGVGLASIDDAAAFLYNFYLSAIDDQLAASLINFVRYRDEYYVFEKQHADHVVNALRQEQLDGSIEELVPSIDELEEDAEIDLSSEMAAQQEELGEPETDCQPQEIERLEHECCCLGWTGDSCTDGFEHTYGRLDPREAVGELWKLAPEQIDAVQVLPILRMVHRARHRSAWLKPGQGRRGYQTLCAQAREHREWLLGAITAGARSAVKTDPSAPDDWWQVTWASRLLSDAGSLTADEERTLRGIVARKRLPSVAGWELRLALARAGTPDTADTWTAPDPESFLEFRTAALAASFWHRRGRPEPWEQIKDGLGRVSAGSRRFLEGFHEGGMR